MFQSTNEILCPDVLLLILLELPIRDILRFRLTCKHFYTITLTRALWLALYNTRIRANKLPIPRLHTPFSSLLSSSGQDQDEHDLLLLHLSNAPTTLERLVLTTLILHENWTSPRPVPSASTSKLLDPLPSSIEFTEVRHLQFVKNRGHAYLLCFYLDRDYAPVFTNEDDEELNHPEEYAYEEHPSEVAFVHVKCWRLDERRPVGFVDHLKGWVRTGFWSDQAQFWAVNEDPNAYGVLTVRSNNRIQTYAIDKEEGITFAFDAPLPNDVDCLHGSHGNFILAERTNKELCIVEASSGQEILLESTSRQSPMTTVPRGSFQTALFAPQALVIVYSDTMEVYAMRKIEFAFLTGEALRPAMASPYAFGSLGCSISLHRLPETSSTSGSSSTQPALSIVCGSCHMHELVPSLNNNDDDMMDVDTDMNIAGYGVNHLMLHPNPTYSRSLPLTSDNSPWTWPPTTGTSFLSSHTTCRPDVKVGPTGTMLWNHRCKVRTDVSALHLTHLNRGHIASGISKGGPPVSGSSLLISNSVMEGRQSDEWAQAAMDDGEGLVAVAFKSGQVALLDYCC